MLELCFLTDILVIDDKALGDTQLETIESACVTVGLFGLVNVETVLVGEDAVGLTTICPVDGGVRITLKGC